MQFFKMVSDYTESPDGTVVELAASNLDQPFCEILRRQNLPSHLQECVYYLKFFFTYAKSMMSFVINAEVLVLLESTYILCFCVTDFGLQYVLGGGRCRIILYAIALADEDQELVADTRRLLTAKEGFANLALYLASVSR